MADLLAGRLSRSKPGNRARVPARAAVVHQACALKVVGWRATSSRAARGGRQRRRRHRLQHLHREETAFGGQLAGIDLAVPGVRPLHAARLEPAEEDPASRSHQWRRSRLSQLRRSAWNCAPRFLPSSSVRVVEDPSVRVVEDVIEQIPPDTQIVNPAKRPPETAELQGHWERACAPLTDHSLRRGLALLDNNGTGDKRYPRLDT